MTTIGRLVLFIALSTAIFRPCAAESQRPNFVICLADDQGFGDTGYSGHPDLKTPVLDEMAATGLRLDRFYSAAPVCSPTRGSLMTGRHPNRYGCFSWGYTLRPQERTVAALLRDAGYRTGHFGKWHLGEVRADSPLNPGRMGFEEWISSPNFYDNSPLFSHRGQVIQTEGESSMVTVEAALPFLREAVAKQQPFLAVVCFGNPHTPHQGWPELTELYSDLPPRRQNYYAELTGVDRAVGRLRDELKSLGVRENTLLIYTSDNGPQRGSPGSSGGLRGAKASLWEGGVRVPALMEWPNRITQPLVSSFPASTSDILPTLLDLAGVPIPDDRPLDGISLAAVIDGKEAARTKPIGFWVYGERGIRTPSVEVLGTMLKEQQGEIPARPASELSAIATMTQKFDPGEAPGHATWLDGSWKLHRIPRNSAFEYELYNLDEDPHEQTNVAEQELRRLRAMRRELRSWQESVLSSLNGEDFQAD